MPFSPIWNDLAVNNQLTWRPVHEANESHPASHGSGPGSAAGAREPRLGLKHPRDLGNVLLLERLCRNIQPRTHLRSPPPLLASPRADSGSAVWKQGTETEHPQRQRDVGTRRGSPRGCSCLVQSAAPALPSAQSFPPASLVSITSSRNANQCICKTWK